MITRILVWLVAVFLLNGCIGIETPVAPPPTTSTATAVPPTATATPTPFLDTPAPMCTPPACRDNEVYFCPDECPGGCGTVCATVTPGPGSAAAPPTWEALDDWLTAAWQNNVNPAAVRAALQDAGWQKSFGDWVGVDLDGDQKEEWVLLLHQPDVESASAHNLWIVNGNGVIYQAYEEPNLAAGFSLQLQITGVADLTGDGLGDLVTNEQSCGAHTCFGTYQIYSTTNGRLQNVVRRPEDEATGIEGDFISVSYPDTRFVDHQQDGVTDFLVHGGSIGSVGAGIVRTYTEVWSWDGTAVTLAETILDHTQYRHHILYEANQLLAAGDLAQAEQLYERTVNDEGLITPSFLATEAKTFADISQFAAARLILTNLMQKDRTQAVNWQDWLNTSYPDTVMTQAANSLFNNWTDTSGMDTLCQNIESDLATHENPTGALVDLGYGNPTLQATDFCP